MNSGFRVVVLLAACLLTACQRDETQDRTIAELKIEVEALKNQISAVAAAKDSSDVAEDLRGLTEVVGRTAGERVLLPTGASGFALGSSEYGRFAVNFADVKPFGPGSEVTLEVLNLASAGISDAKFKVRYATQTVAEYIASRQGGENSGSWMGSEIEAEVPDTFPPARWVRVKVRLPEVKPEVLKMLEIRMSAGTVRASGP